MWTLATNVQNQYIFILWILDTNIFFNYIFILWAFAINDQKCFWWWPFECCENSLSAFKKNYDCPIFDDEGH